MNAIQFIELNSLYRYIIVIYLVPYSLTYIRYKTNSEERAMKLKIDKMVKLFYYSFLVERFYKCE